jgi:hypothetical protein
MSDTPEEPSGLPDDVPEPDPLGVPGADPTDPETPDHGPPAMPGIPDDGEPPDAG